MKRFSEIISKAVLGGNYENSESNSGIPVIKMGNIDRGKISIEKVQYLPIDSEYNKNDILKKGDLLFNTRNTLDLVGKVSVWNEELPLAIYNSNLLKLEFNKENVESNFYMNYVFNSHKILCQLKARATGTTSVAAIYGRDLNSVKFLLPPLPEQCAIANILSTWDTAIQTTQALISHKEAEKKWLMQNLLTGKKRLKGFEYTKWKIQQLENVITPISREIPKPNEPYLGIGLRSHGKGTFLKPDEQPEKNVMDKFYIVRENDLIVNITFAWEQAIAIVKKEDDGAMASHRFPTYTFKDGKGNSDFFKFLILLPRMKFMLEMISPGGAGRNRVMSKTDFLKLEFLIPEIEEQTAIAQVLQTADKEIELLKTKLDQQKLQKKGLMQVLLTGKVRVASV
jgi:type I restriction enzyme S subunit